MKTVTRPGWFDPVVINGHVLPSRVLLAPINTGFTTLGRPTTRLVRFHVDRAGPAIGASVVGNVAVSTGTRTNYRTAEISSDRNLARLSVLSRAIRCRGSLPGIQLAAAPLGLDARRSWGIEDISQELDRLSTLIARLHVDQLSALLSSFVRAAERAIRAGFSYLQVHAAHGYLLALLLDDRVNRRTDEFRVDGSWFERFLDSMRRTARDAVLGVRLSAFTSLISAHEEIQRTVQIIHSLEGAGIDLVDLSAGYYTMSRRLIYPDAHYTDPVYERWIPELANSTRMYVVIAGRVEPSAARAERYPANVLLSVGRALIADPTYADKWRMGLVKDVRPCLLKNRCHYFSRGKSELECGVNSSI